MYEYDNVGRLISMTYPSGRRVDYSFDAGRVEGLSYDFQPVLSNITYRPMGGGLTGWHWSGFPGTVQFDYDLNGRLSGIQDVDEREYVRDARGWITAIADPNDASMDQVYAYRTDGSLIQADLAARPDPIDYRLDENYNIMEKRLGPVDVIYSDFYTNYAINNRPHAVYDGVSTEPLTFDEAGNMLSNGGGLSLTYDAKGRMNTASRFGLNTEFAVNAMGQRVRKSGSHLSTGHRLYAYDEKGRLLGQYDGLGKAVEEYVYLDGHRPVALVRNIASVASVAQVHPVLTDHLGTPRKVLSPSGALLWSWEAKDPYGHQAPNTLHAGTTFEFDLRFPGQIYDVETGLYHNGFRDYDPSMGRYVQADPIGLVGGWNPYAYVGANPIGGSDSSGLVIDGEAFKSENFREALRYISASPIGAEVIKAVVESKNRLTIAETGGETRARFLPDSYAGMPIGGNGHIDWNPSFGMYCQSTKRVLNPALILFHEMVHFLQWQDPTKAIWLRSINFKGGDHDEWTNALEMDAISNYEHQISIDVGGLLRKSHKMKGTSVLPASFDSPSSHNFKPMGAW